MLSWLLALAALGLPPAMGARDQPAPDGQALYDRSCVSCHGKDGRGNPAKAKALKLEPRLLDLARPETAHLDRAALLRILLEGKGRMPAYARRLEPAQAEAVLDHAIRLATTARGK